MVRPLASIGLLIFLASTPLAGRAGALAEPEWVPRGGTVRELAIELERTAVETARALRYLEAPELLPSVHAVMLAASQLAQSAALAERPAEQLDDIRYGIDELTFRMQTLEEAQNLYLQSDYASKGVDDYAQSDGRRELEKVAWYIQREAQNLLQSRHLEAAVLAIEPWVLRAGLEAPTPSALEVSTRGVDSLMVVGEKGGPCEPVAPNVFRCPTPEPSDPVDDLTVQSWKLRAVGKAWFRGTRHQLDLPILRAPGWAGRYQIEFQLEATRAKPELRTETVSVSDSLALAQVRKVQRCIEARPGWSIDPASIEVLSHWGTGGKYLGVAQVSERRFCLEIALIGERARAAKLPWERRPKQHSTYNVVVDYLEFPESASAQGDVVSGTIDYGEERSHRFPESAIGFVYRISLPDGGSVEGTEPISSLGVSIEVLRDRLLVRGWDVPPY